MQVHRIFLDYLDKDAGPGKSFRKKPWQIVSWPFSPLQPKVPRVSSVAFVYTDTHLNALSFITQSEYIVCVHMCVSFSLSFHLYTARMCYNIHS